VRALLIAMLFGGSAGASSILVDATISNGGQVVRSCTSADACDISFTERNAYVPSLVNNTARVQASGAMNAGGLTISAAAMTGGSGSAWDSMVDYAHVTAEWDGIVIGPDVHVRIDSAGWDAASIYSYELNGISAGPMRHAGQGTTIDTVTLPDGSGPTAVSLIFTFDLCLVDIGPGSTPGMGLMDDLRVSVLEASTFTAQDAPIPSPSRPLR
jgi:hypothetical protein